MKAIINQDDDNEHALRGLEPRDQLAPTVCIICDRAIDPPEGVGRQVAFRRHRRRHFGWAETDYEDDEYPYSREPGTDGEDNSDDTEDDPGREFETRTFDVTLHYTALKRLQVEAHDERAARRQAKDRAYEVDPEITDLVHTDVWER